MNFAKKLREVVASNFIEIAKTEGDRPAVNDTHTPEIDRASTPQYMDVRPALPAAAPEFRALQKEEIAAPFEEAADANAIIAQTGEVPNKAAEATGGTSAVAPLSTKRTAIEWVAPNEPVSIDAILSEANLPHVAFAAEQAAKVLSALPNDLPLQVKRLTVKATLDAVDRSRAIDPKEIVADAMLKKGHLTLYRDEFRAKVEALHQEADDETAAIRQQIEQEMARLKAESERLKTLKTAIDRKRRAVELAADERMAQMEQVIVFFQSELASELDRQATARPTDSEEELPSFMRDDAVFRMLGLESTDDDTERDPAPSDEPSTNGVARRTRRRVSA